MYSYDCEKDRYIFSGDLTEYLLRNGVSNEHIDKMKNKILESDRDAYQIYPDLKSPESGYEKLVPLAKVIGTSRGTVGLSVYDNVRTMRRGDREPYRFEKCFSFLNEMSLEELQKSYEELYEPVRMEYYVDDDAYFLSGDGNHRTLTAMLVGAECIRAKVTNAYCDTIKKEKYFYSKAFIKKYKILKIMDARSCYDISFKDEKGIYEIYGFPRPEEDEDMFMFLSRLSKMIDSDISKAEYIKKMPAFIQKLVLHYEKNYRIEQYINKKYLLGEERYLWRYREPVVLYRL